MRAPRFDVQAGVEVERPGPRSLDACPTSLHGCGEDLGLPAVRNVGLDHAPACVVSEEREVVPLKVAVVGGVSDPRDEVADFYFVA